MKLNKFFLKYFPPGICMEFTCKDGEKKAKTILLPDLNIRTNPEELADELIRSERLITKSIRPQLIAALSKLQRNLFLDAKAKYIPHKVLSEHILPLTNVEFNKEGTRCLTGSYDRTGKVWDIETGENVLTLQGHTSVVFAVTFNHPFGDRILTGSFDKTVRVWDSETGDSLLRLWGHKEEVVAVKFDPNHFWVASCSMDSTALLYDIKTGQELWCIEGHKEPVASVQFDALGNLLMTGSFDKRVCLWDLRSHEKICELKGHKKEISCCLFNYDCSLIGTSSIDKTVKLWDVKTMTCRDSINFSDEVLDIAFCPKGESLATACSDGGVELWTVRPSTSKSKSFAGHSDEVSKVCFSPSGRLLLTASADNTARLWDTLNRKCIQVLSGHTDEVFSCAFTYNGGTIITASKDTSCQIWKRVNHLDANEECPFGV